MKVTISRWNGNVKSIECVSMDEAKANLQEIFASEIREHAGEIFSAYMDDNAAEIHRFDNSITLIEIECESLDVSREREERLDWMENQPNDSVIHPDIQPSIAPM